MLCVIWGNVRQHAVLVLDKLAAAFCCQALAAVGWSVVLALLAIVCCMKVGLRRCFVALDIGVLLQLVLDEASSHVTATEDPTSTTSFVAFQGCLVQQRRSRRSACDTWQCPATPRNNYGQRAYLVGK